MLWDYIWTQENPGESPFCKPSWLEPYFYCALSSPLPCDRTGPRDVGMAPWGPITLPLMMAMSRWWDFTAFLFFLTLFYTVWCFGFTMSIYFTCSKNFFNCEYKKRKEKEEIIRSSNRPHWYCLCNTISGRSFVLLSHLTVTCLKTGQTLSFPCP